MNAAPVELPPYVPRGAAARLMHEQSPEVLIAGPAGTGKSIAALFKLHLLAELVPGFRGLVVRKTRESLTESALVTYETKVLHPGHPALPGAQRRLRQAYRYPNGSELVLGGLDKASRVMSTEFDVIYVQEAIEVTEPDWEALTTRLRNARLPYQQLIGDTNPDAPTHWLKKRCDTGRTLLLHSRHEDNPTLWDGAAWTPAGVTYLAKLDALTGNRKQRLRFGRWVQAEGVVYPEWDASVHVIDRFPIPPEWPRYWAIDFGYTAPFAMLFAAKDPEGRLYVYRELYHTGRLVEEHARRINSLVDRSEPRPSLVVCDHAREERGAVEKYLGVATTPARKDITSGIQLVAARLVRQKHDGKPRLFYLRDSLAERDRSLADAGKPCSLVEEMDAYVWSDGGRSRLKGELPVDEANHSADCIRYLCAHLDRPGPAWGARVVG